MSSIADYCSSRTRDRRCGEQVQVSDRSGAPKMKRSAPFGATIAVTSSQPGRIRLGRLAGVPENRPIKRPYRRRFVDVEDSVKL